MLELRLPLWDVLLYLCTMLKGVRSLTREPDQLYSEHGSLLLRPEPQCHASNAWAYLKEQANGARLLLLINSRSCSGFHLSFSREPLFCWLGVRCCEGHHRRSVEGLLVVSRVKLH